jgi:hypothetical protein
LPLLSVPELPFPRGAESFFEPAALSEDLFMPPPAIWVDDAVQAGTDKGESGLQGGNSPEKATRAIFVSSHRLEAVIVEKRLRIAVVDGVWLRVGQSLDGCRLMDILGSEVRFGCKDGEAVLKVSAGAGTMRH